MDELEALRASSKANRSNIRTATKTLIAGVVAICTISGYTIKDLAEPDNPASNLTVLVETSDLQGLGIPIPVRVSPTTAQIRVEANQPASAFIVPGGTSTFVVDGHSQLTKENLTVRNGRDSRITAIASPDPIGGFIQVAPGSDLTLTKSGDAIWVANQREASVWVRWKRQPK